MSKSDSEHLLHMVGPHIAKQDMDKRKTILATDCLAVTLQFLGTGDSYHSIRHLCKISEQATREIVPEVYDAVASALKDYVKVGLSV